MATPTPMNHPLGASSTQDVRPDPPKAPAKGPSQARLHAAASAAAKARTKLAEDVERLCADAGITLAALAREAGVPYQQLWAMMVGKAKPSIETYAKLAVPLGADLATRLYPNTGPTIRDHIQGRILEALLERLHPRWDPFTELIVRQPVRGAIDVAFFEQRERVIVPTEIQSELRRIEQVVRWSREKSDALPSWSNWPAVADARSGEPPRVSQLLVVRATRVTRRVAAAFARQLAVAYPAHPQDALSALTGTAPWPGSALVWARVDREGVRFQPTR